MDFVEDIRIGEEGTEAGFCAEIDRPAVILDAREIRGVRIAELSPAEGDETWELFLLQGICIHNYQNLAKVWSAKPSGQRKTFARLYLLHFRDENFEGADRQSIGRLGRL